MGRKLTESSLARAGLYLSPKSATLLARRSSPCRAAFGAKKVTFRARRDDQPDRMITFAKKRSVSATDIIAARCRLLPQGWCAGYLPRTRRTRPGGWRRAGFSCVHWG